MFRGWMVMMKIGHSKKEGTERKTKDFVGEFQIT